MGMSSYSGVKIAIELWNGRPTMSLIQMFDILRDSLQAETAQTTLCATMRKGDGTRL